MKTTNKLIFLTSLLAFLACDDDLLTVQDPARYTSPDLDGALDAVANGVEGDLYATHDGFVAYSALASDEYQHTGTWAGWDDVDHGRFRFATSPADGIMNGYLRTRWFANSTAERLEKVLGSAAASDKMMAQIQTTKAWALLMMGEGFCEGVIEENGPVVTDVQMTTAALAELTTAMATAQAAGATAYYNWALAGRARANLWLGNWDAALADAKAVPDGFVHYAQYSGNSSRQQNWIVFVATIGYNNAGGVREKWWPHVDTDKEMLIDPYTKQLDKRVEIWHDPGTIGVDGKTDYYSQWKYKDGEADVPMTHSDEMKLIEAEVYYQKGDYAGAQTVLNALRAAVDLDPLPTTTDKAKVMEYLLHETFAELWVEGRRMSYLHRWGKTAEIFKPINDANNLRPLPRPSKFPMSYSEATYNTQIDNSLSSRCLPMSGS
tara:strand:- start:1506 stop:2810 length:1305 start_codon:yes stop_codon:yes gene_type:complete